MKTYRVHLYELVRIAVEVEAEDPLEAAKKADETLDRHALLDTSDGEWAEETLYAMVDELDKPKGTFIEGKTVDYNATSDGFEVLLANEPGTAIALRTAYRQMVGTHARLQEFAEMISRLTKDGERLCKETGRIVEIDDSTMSGDDAVDTVNSLIRNARSIVGEPAVIGVPAG